jgi:hypothetical protein
MYLFLILCIITGIPQVKNVISQIGFKDKTDTICVYLAESMIPTRSNALEVDFNIDIESSICHFNDTTENESQHQLKDKKGILIIKLSDHCPLIQQLIVLKNLTQVYFSIIFSSK